MKTSFSALLASIAVLAALGLAAPTRADLIASYSPDDLTATASPTNIVTMNDDSGHGNPLSGGIYPTLYGSTTGGYNSIFNGRNYANYADQSKAGLETSGALFSGAGARTVVAVYATPATYAGMNAGVAGESAAPGGGNWFTIESRANNVTGDPYLVNFGPDINSLTAPAANRLTFAVATYDGTTESLYWAYGVNGAHSASSVGASLNTVATNFVIGENYSDSAWTGVQIGKVLVYDNALTSTQANALITSLQQYYSPTPEPSSLVLLLIGGAGAMLVYRRRRSA